MNKILKKIFSIAKEQEINQNELSRMSGFNNANISRWVNEQRTPSIDAVERLAAALGYELVLKRKGVQE